ncbi:pentatricopeptide repeat-containing protein At4g21065-like [Ipomoea triloba]|uniref:pentatricopeptide repeat-containing protein At4g21065-like n=1 Tax=Ipomoea triloba TaxID=35885 RepID=UPI00125D1ECF|nr:pentatricopeptide repeat-containing protein At4g21065-like [Ipomoea triloba]
MLFSAATPLRATTSKSRAAEQSCLAILQLCNSLPKLSQVQTQILKLGLESNPLVLTKFASVSSELGAINYASAFIFGPATEPRVFDAFLFNTVIRGFAQTRDSKRNAVFHYQKMCNLGVLPNKFTYPFVLKACAGIGDLRLGETVHGLVVKLGFGDDRNVLNTLVHMYCCCSGGVEYGRKVFDEMPKWDSVGWSVMIGGYARWGMSTEAVGLFRKMQMAGVRPDEITMVSVLSACRELGALELGKWLEGYIEREKVQKSLELCNALVDMFAKCGDVDKALSLFSSMEERNIVSWTCVIDGLAMHGRGLEAVSLFEKMRRAGEMPDEVAFIGLLTACSHSGLVEEGRKYFTSMTKEFGIVPKIEHYGCMVDLFCRGGLVKEALRFVHRMPIEPNAVIWRTLVTACRAHGELKLGEKITKELIKDEPMHDSNYVLLSNIYAKMLNWEKKTMVREVMVKKGMRKTPGSTMVELDNEIYEFVAGDKSHGQYKEIYEMMDEMAKQIKKAGYVATTSEVLLDIDEEDKEDTLNRHSEKLAIAFALMNTPPHTCIRIVKNLRVCEDCHSATKFISKVYKREILVRDRNRFHHFKDGICSCKDFW